MTGKRKLPITILLSVVLLAGLCLLLYPTVSNLWNSYHQSRAISCYTEEVEQLDTGSQQKMLDDAAAYNAALASSDANSFQSPDQEELYDRLLNVNDTGIMGYIEIPAISVSLPIYHGTDEGVLQVGAGHLEGSSLPVGGESTHTVISGHRGLPSSRLFTDLDQLESGDRFMIRVLSEVLTYEVDQIRIVLPEDTSELQIVNGQDYCTLVTCTPYGVNTHRLLVRGHRVETDPEALSIRVVSDAVPVDTNFVTAAIAVLLLAGLFLLSKGKRLLARYIRRNRKSGREQREAGASERKQR